MNTHEEDASMATTSAETETSTTKAILTMSIDNTENAEDGEEFDLEQVRKKEALQRKARGDSMRKRIADNGFALRKALTGATIKGYYPSPLAMEEMSMSDMLSEIPDEDLRFVSSIKDRIYMPAEFFQKWVRPLLECITH